MHYAKLITVSAAVLAFSGACDRVKDINLVNDLPKYQSMSEDKQQLLLDAYAREFRVGFEGEAGEVMSLDELRGDAATDTIYAVMRYQIPSIEDFTAEDASAAKEQTMLMLCPDADLGQSFDVGISFDFKYLRPSGDALFDAILNTETCSEYGL